jgi:Lrp/AsnC family transcriptional regulator, leucine-responsive regulatory protein
MNNVTLDRTDINILNELQRNANLTNVELAARVNLSPSPCLARVKTLEESGVIDRRVTLLNAQTLGLGVTAYIYVKLDRQALSALDNFQNAIDCMREVMECNLMTGDCDYLLRVVVADIEDLERFIVSKLSKIKDVASIRSNLVLRQITFTTALPIDSSRPIHVSRHMSSRRRSDRREMLLSAAR